MPKKIENSSKSPKEILHEYNPLDEVPQITDQEHPTRIEALADKPTELPKKVLRKKGKESYHPLHQR